MKQTIAIVFCVLLLAAVSITGCAGPTSQIKDKDVKAVAEGGTKVPGTAETQLKMASANEKKGEAEAEGGLKTTETTEKLTEKAYVDKKGKFEISSTPFGFVKRDIKRTEKESVAQKESGLPVPLQKESVIPLKPVVKAPATPTELKSESKTEPVAPALQPYEKLLEGKAPEKTGQISFDFDDADLYAVIRTMADLLKINYIIDPTVSGKVTIHTAGLLKTQDVFPVFYQTLEVNGLTAVKEGNVYRILKLKDALRMPISSRLVGDAKDIPPEERIVIQIIPLKFISAQEVTKVITPFISADGTIISEGGSNTLLVVDKGVNILKILKLVEVFDVSIFEKISYRFYTLANINAEDAVKLLKEVLALSTGGIKDDVKFIPISRLNTLLVVSSSPDVIGKVDTFIHQLDLPSEAAQAQIYIYSVKNGMATDLSGILNSIFGKGTEIKKGEGKESVPTNPFAKGSAEKKKTSETTKPSTAAAPSTPTTPAATETGSSVALRGDIKITPDPIRNALIIEAIPRDYQLVEKILGRLDVLPRQVLIEVLIAEVTLDEGTKLGLEWTFKKDGVTGLIGTGSQTASIGSAGLSYVLGLSEKWKVALNASATDSKLDIISSPSVLASDNKQARIDVTTEVPIPSTSYTYVSNGENVLETQVEYRNTGVILEVTPHINEFGLVTMDISQEVSNVGAQVRVAGKDYYSFDARKILTSLTVKHNQSIVIGGLIKSRKTDASSGVPWLVKVPFLRWLFGYEDKTTSKSELIVMITPRVITSLEDVDSVSEEFKKKIGKVLNLVR